MFFEEIEQTYQDLRQSTREYALIDLIEQLRVIEDENTFNEAFHESITDFTKFFVEDAPEIKEYPTEFVNELRETYILN